MAEIPLWVLGVVVTIVGGFLSLTVLIGTSFIKSSYAQVREAYARLEGAIAKFEASLALLMTHKTVHEEWRKTTEQELHRLRGRIGPLERKVFGTVRADDTPTGRDP